MLSVSQSPIQAIQQSIQALRQEFAGLQRAQRTDPSPWILNRMSEVAGILASLQEEVARRETNAILARIMRDAPNADLHH